MQGIQPTTFNEKRNIIKKWVDDNADMDEFSPVHNDLDIDQEQNNGHTNEDLYTQFIPISQVCQIKHPIEKPSFPHKRPHKLSRFNKKVNMSNKISPKKWKFNNQTNENAFNMNRGNSNWNASNIQRKDKVNNNQNWRNQREVQVNTMNNDWGKPIKIRINNRKTNNNWINPDSNQSNHNFNGSWSKPNKQKMANTSNNNSGAFPDEIEIELSVNDYLDEQPEEDVIPINNNSKSRPLNGKKKGYINNYIKLDRRVNDQGNNNRNNPNKNNIKIKTNNWNKANEMGIKLNNNNHSWAKIYKQNLNLSKGNNWSSNNIKQVVKDSWNKLNMQASNAIKNKPWNNMNDEFENIGNNNWNHANSKPNFNGQRNNTFSNQNLNNPGREDKNIFNYSKKANFTRRYHQGNTNNNQNRFPNRDYNSNIMENVNSNEFKGNFRDKQSNGKNNNITANQEQHKCDYYESNYEEINGIDNNLHYPNKEKNQFNWEENVNNNQQIDELGGWEDDDYGFSSDDPNVKENNQFEYNNLKSDRFSQLETPNNQNDFNDFNQREASVVWNDNIEARIENGQNSTLENQQQDLNEEEYGNQIREQNEFGMDYQQVINSNDWKSKNEYNANNSTNINYNSTQEADLGDYEDNNFINKVNVSNGHINDQVKGYNHLGKPSNSNFKSPSKIVNEFPEEEATKAAISRTNACKIRIPNQDDKLLYNILYEELDLNLVPKFMTIEDAIISDSSNNVYEYTGQFDRDIRIEKDIGLFNPNDLIGGSKEKSKYSKDNLLLDNDEVPNQHRNFNNSELNSVNDLDANYQYIDEISWGEVESSEERNPSNYNIFQKAKSNNRIKNNIKHNFDGSVIYLDNYTNNNCNSSRLCNNDRFDSQISNESNSEYNSQSSQKKFFGTKCDLKNQSQNFDSSEINDVGILDANMQYIDEISWSEIKNTEKEDFSLNNHSQKKNNNRRTNYKSTFNFDKSIIYLEGPHENNVLNSNNFETFESSLKLNKNSINKISSVLGREDPQNTQNKDSTRIRDNFIKRRQYSQRRVNICNRIGLLPREINNRVGQPKNIIRWRETLLPYPKLPKTGINEWKKKSRTMIKEWEAKDQYYKIQNYNKYITTWRQINSMNINQRTYTTEEDAFNLDSNMYSETNYE